MKKALARAAYTSLLHLATPFYLARLWWRGRRGPGYRVALPERLGHGKVQLPAGPLWIHAVSLGETRAAAALIDALRAARPGLHLLLTHGTATGRAAGAPLMTPGDHQAGLLYVTPAAVRLCQLRLHLDRALVCGDGVVAPAQIAVDVAQSVVRGSVLRIQLDGPQESGYRL